jgi:hypothetical protein
MQKTLRKIENALNEVCRIAFEIEASGNSPADEFRNHQRSININSIANQAKNELTLLSNRVKNDNSGAAIITTGNYAKLRKMLAQMSQTATAAHTCRSDEEILRTAYLEDIDKLCKAALALFSNSPENENTVADNVTARKLPDGWKMYDKYQIRHTDGTPLKGKQYFVLRLDSDDPLEAARVVAAMSAYKGEAHSGNEVKLREALKKAMSFFDRGVICTSYANSAFEMDELERWYDDIKTALAAPSRQCDVGTPEEQLKRFKDFCRIISKDETCHGCPLLPQCSTLEHCTLTWAQMPYTESEAKA